MQSGTGGEKQGERVKTLHHRDAKNIEEGKKGEKTFHFLHVPGAPWGVPSSLKGRYFVLPVLICSCTAFVTVSICFCKLETK